MNALMAMYYDEVYKDKDYKKEAEYVLGLIGHTDSVLDLGCGTGRHSEQFARAGKAVYGVDANQEMIRQARHRIPCTHDDVRTYEPYRKFGAVVSLFHVASCMTTYTDLISLFKTAHAALAKGGVFVFDFWYGSAVLVEFPKSGFKDINDSVRRYTKSSVDHRNNIVRVTHTWDIDGNTDNTENHEIRYWFLPELKECLSLTGFEMEKAEHWMGGPIGFDTWYGCIVARKK